MTQHTLRAREGRLDAFLREAVPLLAGTDVSNSKIRRLIVAGAVSVNGRQCRRPAFVLRGTETVTVSIDSGRLLYERQPDDIAFVLTKERVLYEDDVLIVIDKPPFIPTEATVVEGRASVHQAVIDYLWAQNPSLRNPPYAGIMHRLDRETSGVLLFTKSRAVNASIHAQFEGHTVRKQYRAVCSVSGGGTVPDTFFVDMCMGRVSPRSSRCKMGSLSPVEGGLPSRTDFRVVRREEGILHVDAFPLTGRTHQIRLHLSSLNLPIVGDELYGGTSGIAGLGNRIMLHARSLSFTHPVSDGRMTVTAPLPEGF